MFRTIAIFGSGTIGASWAAFYALKGLEVVIYDIDAKKSEEGFHRASSNIKAMQRHGLADQKSVTNASKKLKVADAIETLGEQADFVQESIVERIDIKRDAYKHLEKVLPPDTIIASSSSGLRMTEIQEPLSYPQRTLIAHPFNPPHLLPLVELVAGKYSATEVIDQAFDFFESLGKIPVRLSKEVPGHIANRLSAALWREALDLVGKGVASVEDVDKALFAGPGLRWSFMGPHLTYHLGGGEGGYENFMEHLAPAFENWLADMSVWSNIPHETKEAALAGIQAYVGKKNIPELERWRDANLATLVKALNLWK